MRCPSLLLLPTSNSMEKDILSAVVIHILRVCSYRVKVEHYFHPIQDITSRVSYIYYFASECMFAFRIKRFESTI
jgi:hypothetical protein